MSESVSEVTPVASWILCSVFSLAGCVAVAASVAGWDWFFGTRSARALGGSSRKRARIIYGVLGAAMITAAWTLII